MADLVPPALWRRRRLLLALTVLLAVRAILPVVVRRQVISRASEALHARVDVGDVDLALLRCGIALKDVAIRPAAGPPDAPPLIAWKRFAVAVRWLPLLRHTVRLRAIELDAPQVALDRLADGQLNLLALVPGAGAPPAEAPPAANMPPAAAAPPSRWRIGADRIVLREGTLRFRDLTIVDHEPIELGLESIDVAEVSLAPGLYDEQGHVRLHADVEGGSLDLDARLAQREAGTGVAATLRARRLPLRRARFYVPGVGWSELQGALEAALKYRLEPATRNQVYGGLALTGLAVRVPGIDEPALGWERLAVRVHPLDLLAHRAAVGEVTLTGASLVVRAQGGDLLPFLAGMAGGGKASSAPAPAPAPTGPPWRWRVGVVRVADLRVRLLGASEPEPVTVGVTLSAKDLAGDGGGLAPVELALALEPGSVRADGLARVAPPGFAGRIRVAELDLPRLVAAAGALPAGLLQAGVLESDLTVEAGVAAEGGAALAGGDVRVRGTVDLTKPWLAAADANEFAVGGGGVRVGLTEVRVPGVLGTESAGGPLAVTLGEIRLDAPIVRLTRTAGGMVMPAFTRSAPPAETATPPPAPTPAPTPARPMTVALDALLLTDGQLRITDQTVKPYYTGELSPLAGETRGIGWPPPTVEKLHLTTRTPEKGDLEVTGSFTPAGGTLEVKGRDIALTPFNPFATTLSGYSVGGGRLTLTTRAKYGKDGRYTVTNAVTLQRLAVRGGAGESLFQQHFGVPIEMALALMRDVHGNIGLDVPITGDAAGTRVDVLAVVGGALRHAIVNALASPLKLAGSLFGGGGGAEALVPAPIAFLPGRAELDKTGDEQVRQLAGFLASRPGIAVILDGTLTAADVRWLREQALREELGASQGVFGALRNLPQRGTRGTIRDALEARAQGKEGPLSADDAATLDRWLAERPPLPPERLRRLADERTARVETTLRERHGIEPKRITRHDPGEPRAEGTPGVQLTIGAAES